MFLHGKVVRLGCIVFMMAALVPAFAQTEPAVAGTPAFTTTVKAALKPLPSDCKTHVNGNKTLRSLSAVTQTKVQNLCADSRKHQRFIRRYTRNAHVKAIWLPHRALCADAPRHNKKWATACYKLRQKMRPHAQRLLKLNRRLQSLLPHAPGDINLPYRHFSSCKDAVKYIFAGRADEARAEMVVHRESTDSPNASNGTHMGCAEESAGMRQAHLHGPWNDAFWNVLAMRDVVDDSSYGWCHWDIVNYCLPGGEF